MTSTPSPEPGTPTPESLSEKFGMTLVERLRKWAGLTVPSPYWKDAFSDCGLAADRLERAKKIEAAAQACIPEPVRYLAGNLIKGDGRPPMLCIPTENIEALAAALTPDPDRVAEAEVIIVAVEEAVKDVPPGPPDYPDNWPKNRFA